MVQITDNLFWQAPLESFTFHHIWELEVQFHKKHLSDKLRTNRDIVKYKSQQTNGEGKRNK